MMYAQSVNRLARQAGLSPVQGATASNIKRETKLLYNKLDYLPFCNLKTGKHKFGVLRGWVKSKNFLSGGSRESLKMRPLISFRGHRRAKLFKLLSAF